MTGTVTVRRDDLETMMAYLASGPWTPAEKPGVAEAWRRLTEAKDADLDAAEAAEAAPEPQEPPGEFLRVQVKGYQEYEGWVTEGTFCGSPYVFVRDSAGRLIAKLPPDSVHCLTPLLPSLAGPRPLAALPAGEAYEGYYEPGDEDEGPADAFPGHRGPDETAIL